MGFSEFTRVRSKITTPDRELQQISTARTKENDSPLVSFMDGDETVSLLCEAHH